MDSNVLLDMFNDQQPWAEWSQRMLDQYRREDELAINSIIYAEISVQFDDVETLDRTIPANWFHRLTVPYAAAFLAGKAFKQYRQRGGARRSPLPDFFIGAHAQVEGLALLTRDKARYQTYFPEVRLIAP